MKLWNTPVMDELNVDMTLGGIEGRDTEENALKWAGMPFFDDLWEESIMDGTLKPS